MLGKLELTDFPLDEAQIERTLQALAKQIHARYTSRFTLLLVLPEAARLGQRLEELLKQDGAHPVLATIGIADHTTEDGKTVKLVVEPPSTYLIRGRPLVLFSGSGDWPALFRVASLLKDASSREISVFICQEEGIPDWVNHDYIGFTVPKNIVVSGFGLNYNSSEASGGMLTASMLEG